MILKYARTHARLNYNDNKLIKKKTKNASSDIVANRIQALVRECV